MTRYSVQARDWTFVKSDEFLSFAKNMSRYIGKNISKNVRSKYSQNVTDHAKQSGSDALKTASKRAIQKPENATSDLIGNKVLDRFRKVSKTSAQNNSERNIEHDREKYLNKNTYLQNKSKNLLMI